MENRQEVYNKYHADFEAELDVLGTMIEHQEVIPEVTDIINVDALLKIPNQIIFQTIVDLHTEGVTVDEHSIIERLSKKGELNRIGGAEEIGYIVESRPNVIENVQYYAKILHQLSVERHLLQLNKTIPEIVKDDSIEFVQKLNKIEKSLFDIIEQSKTKTSATFRNQVKDTIAWWDKQFDREIPYEIATGFPQFDQLTLGLHYGEYTIIAGRPSVGKSAFALNVIIYTWLKHKIPSMIISYEESSRSILMRMASIISGVPLYLLRAVSQSVKGITRGDNKYEGVIAALSSISDMPIPLLSVRPTIAELSVLVRRTKAKQKDLGILLVDHIQIAPGQKGEGEYDKISSFSQGLKAIAIENDIAVVGVSQLSRASMEGRRPELHHLRASGALEQDSDVVIFIYNTDDDFATDTRQVYIAKQRNGPKGDLSFSFNAENLRFKEA